MNWCRLWHDLPNDPKFRTIARVSESRTADVISVYVHLLVSASKNETERGRTQPNAEDLASALDLATERVQSILDAMQGRVLSGEYLSGWDKRQPKREDGSAERARNWRDSSKLHKIDDPTNATERNRTQPNAPDKIRRDEDETRRETVVVISPLPGNRKVSDGRDETEKRTGTGKQSVGSSAEIADTSDRPENPSRNVVSNSRINEMQEILHGFMQAPMADRPPRTRKPPDRDIAKRCVLAVNGAELSQVAGFLRQLRHDHKIPETGPRTYAWFEPVLAEQFRQHS